ncbi:hypothetical protein WJX79_000156 [Trebouxia sp. C0005]
MIICFLRTLLYSLRDKDNQCRGSNVMKQQSEEKQRTYRYNRRAGQKRRGRRCGQRGFGQRRFAQSAPSGNAAVHDVDGTISPGVVTGYPVYPKSQGL